MRTRCVYCLVACFVTTEGSPEPRGSRTALSEARRSRPRIGPRTIDDMSQPPIATAMSIDHWGVAAGLCQMVPMRVRRCLFRHGRKGRERRGYSPARGSRRPGERLQGSLTALLLKIRSFARLFECRMRLGKKPGQRGPGSFGAVALRRPSFAPIGGAVSRPVARRRRAVTVDGPRGGTSST